MSSGPYTHTISPVPDDEPTPEVIDLIQELANATVGRLKGMTRIELKTIAIVNTQAVEINISIEPTF